MGRPLKKRGDPQETFWTLVNKTQECWIWTAAQREGYGTYGIWSNGRTITYQATRLSYKWHYGLEPEGRLRHWCGNSLCVRPDHLFTRSPEYRFWEHVEKTDTCWNWKHTKADYGRFVVNRKSVLAHRFSYALRYGQFDDSLCVLHKCDNPRCVRPSHLFLGTRQENMDDMVKKRRHSHGTKHPRSKLTDEEIRVIRSISYSDLNDTQLGRALRVTGQTIKRARLLS